MSSGFKVTCNKCGAEGHVGQGTNNETGETFLAIRCTVCDHLVMRKPEDPKWYEYVDGAKRN